jgi:ABC-type dipeptide/oligopeptide/nickel transport system ATPase component
MNLIEFINSINSNNIIGIVGDLGDGKSIVGVSIISILRTLSLITDTPLIVSSNIPLKYPHHFIEYYDQLDNLFDTLIFVDEIHLIADSRNSQGKQNFFTSGITMKVRKTGSKMIWTSQESSQVEKRVRNRTTLFLNPIKLYPNDVNNLQFKINLVSKHKRFLGDIILNLEGFKDDYSTHYVPLPLLNREDDD